MMTAEDGSGINLASADRRLLFIGADLLSDKTCKGQSGWTYRMEHRAVSQGHLSDDNRGAASREIPLAVMSEMSASGEHET